MLVFNFLINKRIAFLLVLFLSLSFSTFAEIEIVNQNNATDGNCNGSIEVLATGSSGAFTIRLEGSTVMTQTNDVNGNHTFDNLCPDEYKVIVIDMLGCETKVNVSISACGDDLEIGSSQVTEPSSCTGSNGEITVGSVSGGITPYSYNWNNGMTGTVLSGLPPGMYTLTVTDAIGCTTKESFDLMDNSNPEIELVVEHSCGEEEGSIMVIGGSLNYYFQWSTGAQVIDLNNISPGTYTLTVTDVSGCSSVRSAIVKESFPPVILDYEQILPTCEESSDGTTTIGNILGNAPYTYQWANDGGWVSSTNASNALGFLSFGTYTVTITDYYGCTSSKVFTNENSQYPFEIELDNAGSNFINIEVIGNSSSYSYSWEGENNFTASSQDINFSTSGDYSVTVTENNNGCTKTKTFTTCDSPVPLELEMNGFATTTCEFGIGAIEGLWITGGVEPFTFSWMGPSGSIPNNTQIAIGLTEPGTYTVTVLDACYQQSSISQELKCDCDLRIDLNTDKCDYNGFFPWKDSPGAGEFKNVVGAEAGDRFYLEWSNGNTGLIEYVNSSDYILIAGQDEITGLNQGSYSLLVIDEYGCKAYQAWTVDSEDWNSDNYCTSLLSKNNWILQPGNKYKKHGPNNDVELTELRNFLNTISNLGELVIGVWTQYGCPSDLDGDDIRLIQYEPFDITNPCSGGGILGYICGNGYLVQSSGMAIDVNVENGHTECGCLFPTELIQGTSFNQKLVEGGISNNSTIFAWYDCNSNTPGIPPSNFEPFGPNADYCFENFGCEDCNQTSNYQTCSYDYLCLDDSPVTIESYSMLDLKFVTDGISCSLIEQCVLDPCNYTIIVNSLEYSTNSGFVEGIDASTINSYLINNEDNPINCENSIYCTCSELEQFFSEFIESPNCPPPPILAIQGGNSSTASLSSNESVEGLSEPLEIKNTYSENYFELSAFPNPFKSELNILLNSSEESIVTIQLLNLYGKAIIEKEYNIKQGANAVQLLLDTNLPTGIYYLYASNNKGKHKIHKVVHLSDYSSDVNRK